MQYLGEYLSPNNSISADSDTLTKYFYFRPDMYDDPDADLENIFIIKNMQEFPKRYDLLAENNLYAVDSIDVTKRISEEESEANKRVSFIVTATYDLLENIRSRENQGQDTGNTATATNKEVQLDVNGNEVTSETLPWEQKPEISFDYRLTTVPLLYGYDSNNAQTIPIVNGAGSRLLTETENYRLQITYRINKKQLDTNLTEITQPVVNSDEIVAVNFGNKIFPSGTLLMYPPTYSDAYYKYTPPPEEGLPGVEFDPVIERYWKYNITFLFSPTGWKRELLNIGTQAIFEAEGTKEQIYLLKEMNKDGGVSINTRYTNLSDVLATQTVALKENREVSYEMVTEPMPLRDDGYIDLNAIKTQTYGKKTFTVYPSQELSRIISW